MLWQNTSTGDRSVWLMNGTTWDGSYAVLPQVPPAWSIAGSGDFNADGNADIVWQNTSTGDRSIWFMTGSTWGGTYALLPQVSTDWSIAGVGDFNYDGKPDLVWQNMTTGDRSIWFMEGSTWNGGYALLPQVAVTWEIAAVGDFDGDLEPDLVWQNSSTGERSIWFMLGAGWSGNYASLLTVPPAWQIAAAADFDGDADPDLVWQNTATGERSIWLMTGSSWDGSFAILPTVPTEWNIAGVLGAPMMQTLSVTRVGNGSGTITSSPAGINCGADCSEIYNYGLAVTLTASPSAGSTFTGWSGGGCSGTGTCIVTMSAGATVAAMFTLNRYTLFVSKTGNGPGTVTSSPAGINCGPDCSEIYDHGTVVTLTASPSAESIFTGWSGGGCTGTGSCTVDLSAAKTVTATFTLSQFSLTIARMGNGTGAVTSSPAGINCGMDCSEIYNYGATVTLTAIPSAGSTFTGWSGGGCAGNTTCTTTMLAPKTVTAVFTVNQYVLAVTKAGGGSGTVTSNPAGINCGADCSEPYNYGTSVTLTAIPVSGSGFTGWSGGGCMGSGTCTLALTAATTVTATFTLLDVTAPTLVSSNPANAAIGAATNATIQLTFSEPMNQAQTQAAFLVTSPTGVTGSFQWAGNTLIFTPAAAFSCTQFGTTVQWTLSTAARDLAGNPIASAAARSFRVIRCVTAYLLAENSRDGSVTNTGVVDVTGARIYVGDYSDNTFARGFVSFDFSVLPSDAVPTSGFVVMQMARRGAPDQLSRLVAEPIVYGTLDASDFSLTPIGLGVEADLAIDGAYWQLNAAIVDAWNNRATRGFRLQLRLRTRIDYYINGSADGFDFESTEGGGASRAPQLQVHYTAP